MVLGCLETTLDPTEQEWVMESFCLKAYPKGGGTCQDIVMGASL